MADNHGIILRRILKEKNISQSELARKLDITRGAVNAYMNSETLRRPTLNKITEALNISEADFLYVKDPKPDFTMQEKKKYEADRVNVFEHIAQIMDGMTRKDFIVHRDVMPPEITNGSILICAKTEPKEIEDSNIYVIDYDHTCIVRRITNRIEEKGVLILTSDNMKNQPKVINLAEIKSLWAVKLIISMPFTSQHNMDGGNKQTVDELKNTVFQEVREIRGTIETLSNRMDKLENH